MKRLLLSILSTVTLLLSGRATNEPITSNFKRQLSVLTKKRYLLFLFLLVLQVSVNAQDRIYWGVMGLNISSAKFDGTDIRQSVTLSGLTYDMETDFYKNELYWGEGSKVQKAKTDGTGKITLYTSSGTVGGLALDLTNSKLYFNVWGGTNIIIYQCNLDGSDLKTILTSPIAGGNTYTLSISPTLQKLYWTQGSGISNYVMRCNLDGSGVETLMTVTNFMPGLTIDEKNQKIYLAYYTDNKVMTTDMTCSTAPTQVFGSSNGTFQMAVNNVENKLYFAEISSSKIRRCNLDGSSPENIISLGSGNIMALSIPTVPPAPTIPANGTYTFALSDFLFSSVDKDLLTKIKITVPVGKGTMYLDANSNNIVDAGEAVALNQEILKEDIVAGKLKFNPVANETGLPYTTFSFKWYDGTTYSVLEYQQYIYVLDVAPIVTTQAVTSISSTTATGNGNITLLGVPAPTAYGVCWNTTGTPTTANSKVDKGAASAIGVFTASMSGLTASTTYHVRAFATNTTGTSYGAEQDFTTLAAAASPTVSSVGVPSNGTYRGGNNLNFTVNFSEAITVNTTGGTPYIPITLNTGGTVNASYVSGSGTTALVFIYTVADGNLDNDGISVGSAITANGGTLKNAGSTDANLTLNSVGSTTGVLIDAVAPTVSSVSSTTANGTYKLGDVIAITITFSEPVTVTGTPTLGLNSGGSASYNSGSGTSTLTFNYTVGAGQSSADLDYSAIGSLTLSGGTILDAAGNATWLSLPTVGGPSSLGGQKNIVIATAPTVSTQAVSSILATTATGNGNITALGSSNPTAYGVCWNTTGTPTTADNKVDKGAASVTGAFTASMTGLTGSTTYHVRAFATNSVDTSYGDEVTFTTAESTNLLSNPGAELDYNSWTFTNGNPTYGWGITGSSYSGAKAWASSYDRLGLHGTASQTVDLATKGYTPADLDLCMPIYASGYIAGNGRDGWATIKVELLNASDAVMNTYYACNQNIASDSPWTEYETTITGYSSGLRKIRYTFAGGETAFYPWAGTYGPKFDETELRLLKVNTKPATPISYTSATLNADVYPMGLASTAKFEYGTTSGSYTSFANVPDITGTSVNVNLTGLSKGTTYYFRIVLTNSSGTFNGQEVSFNTLPCINPTNGGTIAGGQNICSGTAPESFTSTLLPTGHAGVLEYKWQSSTTNATSGFGDIASSNSATFAPGNLTATTWYKRLARVDCMDDWTGAVESNVLQVTVTEQPVAAAGPDQTLCNTSTFTMAAVPTVGTGAWSFVGASGTAVIATPGSATTTITSVPTDQNITLRWTETNGICSSFDDVIIHNDAQPVAAAGVDQSLCNTSTFTMAAMPTVGTGAWSFVGASGTAVITTAGSATTTITSVPTDQNITLRWTETNGTCSSSSDDMVIRNDAQPVAAAGVDQTLCNTSTFTMAAVPTVGTGAWSFVGASGTAVITTAGSATTTITSVPTDQNITLRWTETNGTCASFDDVVIRNDAQPVAAAGAGQTLCNTSTFTMAAVPTVGTGAWSFVGASGTAVITTPGSASTTITSVPTDQDITLRWTETNGTCSSFDDVVIRNDAQPVAAAGADQTLCNTSTFTMAAVPTVGTGAWSFVGASGTAVITTPGSATTTITSVPTDQNITLRWTETNGTCSSFDDVVIRNDAQSVAAAGADQTLCNTSTFTMAAVPTVGTGAWSFVGASGTAVITTASSATTTITSVPKGQNITLRWTETNGTCSSFDDVVIRNDAPPVASAGADQAYCNSSVFSLAATPSVGTGSWSFVGDAGTAIISSPGSPNTLVTSVPTEMNITLRWTEVNSTCSSFDDLVIRNDAKPVAAAGADQTLCNTSTFTMAAVPTVGHGTWSFVGPSGTAVITNPGSATTTITSVPTDQNITLRWTETNGTCSSFDDIVIHNDAQPVAIAGADQTLCNTSTFTMAAVPTVGTGVWSFVGESGSAVITTPESASTTITSVSTNQNITLRWTETNGTCSSFDDMVIFSDIKPVAFAGTDQTQCNTSTFTMAAVPTVGAGLWSFVGESGSAVITTPGSATTTITSVPTNQNITLRWTETNGTCSSFDDVVIRNDAQPVAAAGTDQTLCNTSTFTMAAVPTVGTGAWSFVGESGSAVITTPGSASTTITSVPTEQNITLRWTETNGTCSSFDDVIIRSDAQSVAAAGADQALCNTSTFTMAAVPTIGTGVWSFVGESGSAVITTPGLATTTITSVPENMDITLRWTETNGTCSSFDDVVIRNNSLPAIITGLDKTICLNSGTTIDVEAVPGNTYSWTSVPEGFTSDLANPTVSPLETTTYYLTETNAAGCNSTSSLKVTVNQLPAAIAGPDKIICVNSGTTIGAEHVSGSTYSWSSVPAGFTSTEANPEVYPLVSTVYTVTETNANGCVNSNSVSVKVKPQPEAYAGLESQWSVCLNSSTTLGKAPVSEHSYSWTSVPAGFTSDASDPTVSPVVNTVYTLVETDLTTGCSASNSISLTVNPIPEAIAGSDRAVCFNSATTIGATAVEGHTYNWTSVPAGFTSNLANPTVSPEVNTTYKLIETITATGCINKNSVNITVNPLPTATLIGDAMVCAGTATNIGISLTGKAPWSILVNDGTTTRAITGITANTYQLTVIPPEVYAKSYSVTGVSDANGCTNTGTGTITVSPLPAANAGANQSVCPGSDTTIGAAAVPGSSYSWTSAPEGFTSDLANPTVSPLVTTTYTLTETNANGCTKSNTVKVVVNQLPADAGLVSGKQSVNAGQVVIYSVPAIAHANSYLWILPDGATGTGTTNSITVTFGSSFAEGNISVKGINTCGEGATSALAINLNKAPVANAGNAQVVDEGTLVTLDGSLSSDPEGSALTYTWTAPDGIVLSSASGIKPTFTAPEVTADTDFTFILSVNDGYLNSITNSVTVTVKNVIKTDVDLTSDSNLKIYPNPTNGFVTIEGMNPVKSTKITVYTIDGKLIMDKTCNMPTGKIDLRNQAPGTYLLIINKNQVTKIKKQ